LTPEQAGGESTAILGRLETQFPQTNTNLTLLVSSMTDEIARKESAPEVMISFALVGLILLIACATSRIWCLPGRTNRTKEFAVRGALGATSGRLARQLLTESLLLFFFDGAAGALWLLGDALLAMVAAAAACCVPPRRAMVDPLLALRHE
jgi:putative ABC transport system permease protein